MALLAAFLLCDLPAMAAWRCAMTHHHSGALFRAPRWWCAGCGKEHAGTTTRWVMEDGKSYCQRRFFYRLDRQKYPQYSIEWKEA